jgi:Ca2+-binding RTX toxin-like protein
MRVTSSSAARATTPSTSTWVPSMAARGDDRVFDNYGTVNGDAGDDRVFFNEPDATFNGGEGNDQVSFNAIESTFIGGPGFDTVGIGANPVDGP